jgi:dihydrofolate synthase/folylpolyglutamate synthase
LAKLLTVKKEKFMDMTEYEEMVARIQKQKRFGKACGRDVTREMMCQLGYPEKGMKIIHIAGTNGKGSTAAFVSSILQAAGFVVGQFTSPHLVRFTERIRVGQQEIPPEDVVRLGQRILDLPLQWEPTMFDICLGIAILYFKERQCDYVVLETGLGGGKDSTTGLSQVPLVCGITNIGLEHTAVLGDTIEEIAAEKAGILKEGTQLVIGKMDPKAEKVIRERADALEVPARNVDNLLTKISTYKIPLNGVFQRDNAALAIGIVETIFNQDCGYLLDKSTGDPAENGHLESILQKGIASARWSGRMEILRENPYLMVDGAHNPQAVESLFNSLKTMFPGEKFIFLVGVMADKDYGTMMQEILPLAKVFFAVTPENGRSLPAQELAAYLKTRGVEAESFSSLSEALAAADTRALADGTKIIAFGSLYFAGEILSLSGADETSPCNPWDQCQTPS